MGSLLVEVKAKMSLHANDKVRGVLEGEYGSVFKGRSMDFEDLREYIPGDDIKDIDWRATARSGQTLIRRYVAIRKHNILLVVNTGRNMNATGTDGNSKKDTTILTAGVIGYLATKHGDLVGMISGDSRHTRYFKFKGDNTHLESILQHLDKAIDDGSDSGDISSQLEYITKNLRRKMMLIVISDDSPFSDATTNALRLLRAQHEILWIQIADSDGLSVESEFYDIDSQAVFHDIIRRDKSLQQAFIETQAQRTAQQSNSLKRLNIVTSRIESIDKVISSIFLLLERKKHAR